MKRLKNRRQAPPNGFLYTQKETGWQNWKVEPSSQWDFYLCARAIQAHRKANPQFRLSTSLPSIEEELDLVTAARVAAIPGTESYLMEMGSAIPPFLPAPQQTLEKLQLVAGAKALNAGIKTILDFEESGEPPVSNELATQRADICHTCPKNESGGLSRFFTIPASELIKAQLERAHEMKLTTALDNQLNVCSACLCPLKLKVHFPLSFILKHMSEEIKAKLDQRCWITKETV